MYFINNNSTTITNTSITNVVAKTSTGSVTTATSIMWMFVQSDLAYFTVYSETIIETPFTLEIVITG